MPDPASLRVLLVEDDPAMVILVRRLLEADGYRRFTVAATGADAMAAAGECDLVILDHQLPDTTGMDLLPRLVGRPDPPSVVMVTGAGSETIAAGALRAGADDYVPKGAQLRELLPAIVERVRRNRALRAAGATVEQELVRAERAAAIGEMTVTLHHEINNPLMGAAAEIEILCADQTLAPAHREAAQSVRAALHRIRDIIKRAGELRQAESQSYLEGLRMIDLHAPAASAATHRGRALLWITDNDVARLTALLLRHAGFSVERVASGAELEVAARQPGVMLVVVSAVGSADPAEALGGFRPDPSRWYGLAALVAGDPSGAREAGADRIVTLPFDPARLAEELIATAEARGG